MVGSGRKITSSLPRERRGCAGASRAPLRGWWACAGPPPSPARCRRESRAATRLRNPRPYAASPGQPFTMSCALRSGCSDSIWSIWWPNGRCTAAGSAAVGSSPCRRRPAHRPRFRGSASPGRCHWHTSDVSSRIRPRCARSSPSGCGPASQLDRRRERRVAAENQQQLDRARVQVLHQVLQRRELIHRVGLDRIGIEDSVPDIAQRRVHTCARAWTIGRLVLAGDHQARALVQLQVARDRAEPFVDVAVFALLGTVAAPRLVPAPTRIPRCRRRAAAADGRLSCPSASASARPRRAGSCRYGRGARGRGELARAYRRLAGPAPRKSASSETMVFAFERS